MQLDKQRTRVSLVTDLDEVMHELSTDVVWMVRPRLGRKYASQRTANVVELTNLEAINLAKMMTFETL